MGVWSGSFGIESPIAWHASRSDQEGHWSTTVKGARILLRMDLAGFQPPPFAARRDRRAGELAELPALVAAGTPRPRNYAANTFPFRASSHFLYLFGLPLPGAHGLWDGGAWTLFVPAPEPDDPLWHGPEPSLSDLQ